MSTPRMRLIIEQQQELLVEHKEYIQEGKDSSQRDIACWEAIKFNLSRPLRKSTVSHIVKDHG